jgi:hypothetical protein
MGFLHGHALQIVRNLHGPALVVWLLLLGLHVLVYLGRALRRTADDVLPVDRAPVRGKNARLYGLAAAVVCGLLLGGALVPAQHRWIDIRHGHHDRSDGQSAALNIAECGAEWNASGSQELRSCSGVIPEHWPRRGSHCMAQPPV